MHSGLPPTSLSRWVAGAMCGFHLLMTNGGDCCKFFKLAPLGKDRIWVLDKRLTCDSIGFTHFMVATARIILLDRLTVFTLTFSKTRGYCGKAMHLAGLWSRNPNFRLQLQASNFLDSVPTLESFWFQTQSDLVHWKTFVIFVQLACPKNYICGTRTQISGSGITIKFFGTFV